LLLNSTKNTPSQIAVLDEGDAIVLSEENGQFMKFKLKGTKPKGLWAAMPQEGSKMWMFQRSELPKPKGK
jgi:hypothetical protein